MIRGTKRPVRPTAAQTLELRASIHNRFDIEVRDAATGELKQRARGFNVICDALWDQLLYVNSYSYWNPGRYFAYVLYGGGSGTPSASDTELFEKIAAIQCTYDLFNRSLDREKSTYYSQCVVTINAEEAVGETITEVGIGYDATHVVTHALLQDMNGNPISITKTDTDVIKIYATIFVHWPESAWYSGAVNLLSNASDFSGDGEYAYGFLEVLSGFCNPIAQNVNIPSCQVSDGTLKRTNISGTIWPTINKSAKTITFNKRLNAGEANIPIRGIFLGFQTRSNYNTDFVFQVLYGSWYTPLPISGEAVGTGDGTTTAFSTAFPVKTVGTVYVDGAAASGATMMTGPGNKTHLAPWFLTMPGYDAESGCFTDADSPLYGINTSLPIDNNNMLYGSISSGNITKVYEYPFTASGIESVFFRPNSYSTHKLTVQVSDDCETWADAASGEAANNGITLSIPSEYQHKKYWRFKNPGESNAAYYIDPTGPSGNIVFDAPPAAGAIITCDYAPDCIAKDENHVFDLQLVLTLGEYSEV